jgi:transcriptional regulator with XRE-family HTH domain
MKGRKVSDETPTMVRELRRRGLSLRKIAQRAKLSKTSVYRLTKGICWEQNLVQPRYSELECVRDERGEQPVHRNYLGYFSLDHRGSNRQELHSAVLPSSLSLLSSR